MCFDYAGVVLSLGESTLIFYPKSIFKPFFKVFTVGFRVFSTIFLLCFSVK